MRNAYDLFDNQRAKELAACAGSITRQQVRADHLRHTYLEAAKVAGATRSQRREVARQLAKQLRTPAG